MKTQKYDIRRLLSDGGGFEERYWKPQNFPVLNQQQMIEYIIHRVEDVTKLIRLKKNNLESQSLTIFMSKIVNTIH